MAVNYRPPIERPLQRLGRREFLQSDECRFVSFQHCVPRNADIFRKFVRHLFRVHDWISGKQFPPNLITAMWEKCSLLITKCFDDISNTKGSPMWAYCLMLIRSQTAQRLRSHIRSLLGA